MATSSSVAQVVVDAQDPQGPLELWRHTLGHGGINALPLPDHVVEATAALRPRLIRIFLQQFFDIYPEHGRFDWSRLDPYMDSFARTGAKIVAAICIKPPPLYPKIDASVWQPSDWAEWQQVIAALVHRYSVDRQIVTHWEIGNEPDIGEDGGCPYLITDGQAYGEYYARTIEPILATFPAAKVGGPAMAVMHNEPLPGFLKYCKRTGVQLDFISWHLYHSDPGRHAYLIEVADLLCRELLGRRPEFFVTEWNRMLFPSPGSVEDAAYESRRAAAVAATILDMRRAGLDWSFYYHLWDQTCFAADFAPFFSEHGIAGMVRHWNEMPHRLGLFSVDGRVRPQYFVYWLLARLGERQLQARSNPREVRFLAGGDEDRTCALAVNYSLDERTDRVLEVHFKNLRDGLKDLTVWRIDNDRRWSCESLEIKPVERRRTEAPAEFMCQVYLPADSVALVELADVR